MSLPHGGRSTDGSCRCSHRQSVRRVLDEDDRVSFAVCGDVSKMRHAKAPALMHGTRQDALNVCPDPRRCGRLLPVSQTSSTCFLGHMAPSPQTRSPQPSGKPSGKLNLALWLIFHQRNISKSEASNFHFTLLAVGKTGCPEHPHSPLPIRLCQQPTVAMQTRVTWEREGRATMFNEPE